MTVRKTRLAQAFLAAAAGAAILLLLSGFSSGSASEGGQKNGEHLVRDNALRMIDEGRQTFRYDTFGDEAFWGGALKLHQAIAGAKLGGVGPGVSPATALAVGLKVDVDALPHSLRAHSLKAKLT